MGLTGFYNLGGIDIDNGYIRVTRFQVSTSYSKIGDTTDHRKYLHIDYDYSLYKDKTVAETFPDDSIRTAVRNRFTHQITEGGVLDIWTLIYDDLKLKEKFRDFDNS